MTNSLMELLEEQNKIQITYKDEEGQTYDVLCDDLHKAILYLIHK